ncbi:MAG: hypothetical protein QW794_02920, partial [Thermosphaera sp.]
QEVDAERLRRYESWLIDSLQKSGINVDVKSKDLARILRLPGFVNPRVNRLVRVIWTFPAGIDPDQLEKRIAEEQVGVVTPFTATAQIPQRERPLRELTDSEILKIVELLREAYKPGYRQFIALYLSGWLAKARVSPISAAKIVKILYESTQDGDPLKTRLSAVIYSYKKAGIDVDAFAKEIETLTGVKPYGLESEISEAAVKGKSGLQEILEEILGEEKALAVIHELTEILRTSSPYKDSIIEILDYEKKIFAVANLRALIMARMRKTDEGFVYKEKVAPVAPTRVVVYDNPIGGIEKLEITFEGQTLTRPLVVGPATLSEIVELLQAQRYSYHDKLLKSVLSAIVNAYIKTNRAERRTEIEAPGFYLIEGKLVPVKFDMNYDKERLKEALELLNELAEGWFKHVQEKFALIVKWSAVAPFNFILKQFGKWMPWIYLYGDSATGKTTLGRIALKMWGLDARYEKTGASIDTVARLGYVLSMSTLPVLINEPGGALSKEEVVEAIKNAIDTTVVRGKFLRGVYVEYPALTPVIFTSNKFLPRDDALLRRLRVITFTFGEKIPLERQWEFKEKVEPRLQVFSEIGKYIAKQVEEDPEILKGEPLQVGENLLAMCYAEVGLPIPEWLKLTYNEQEDYGELIVEEFTERLKKLVNDLYSKYIQKLVVEKHDATQEVVAREDTTLQERVLVLLKANMLPGVSLRGEKVVIKRALLDEIGMGDRISLKSLAEILKMEYVKSYTERVQGNVKCSAAVICPIEDFMNLFIL